MNNPLVFQQRAFANTQEPLSVVTGSNTARSRVKGCVDALYDNRYLFLSVVLLVVVASVLYWMSVRPVFQANMLIHVEETGNRSVTKASGEPGLMRGTQTTSNAEIELVRSRLVISKALEKLNVDAMAEPHYFPVVGRWLAERGWKLPFSDGAGGYAWGKETLTLQFFSVPDALLNEELVVTAIGHRRFTLRDKTGMVAGAGTVGMLLEINTAAGPVKLLVNHLEAEPGVRFRLKQRSKLTMIQAVQDNLDVAEVGTQSGVIKVSLKGNDPRLVHAVLTEIGRQYVAQNAARVTQEADKALDFLNAQLPKAKRALEESEAKYNDFRKARGTVDFGEESRASLQQMMQAKTRKMELEQKRTELLILFTPNHPSVIGIDNQLRNINHEITKMVSAIKSLPLLEQELQGLLREVRTNSDTYLALLSTARQVRLTAASSTSTVRLVDWPMVPERPISPEATKVILAGVLGGLGAGVLAALLRTNFHRELEESNEIEEELGLPVCAVIPHSDMQQLLSAKPDRPACNLPLLAQLTALDPALDSLRILRSVMQFSLGRQKSKVVLITSPTEKLGKSFITANLATLVGTSSRRVLLIDADLRDGDMHRYFNTNAELGLSNLLGSNTKPQSTVRVGVAPGVDFISRGDIALNSSELLMSPRFSDALALLAQDYDLVLINGTPLLGRADAIAVGANVGAIYIVARAGISTRAQISDSVKLLLSAGLACSGVLFNDAKKNMRHASSRDAYGEQWQVRYSKADRPTELPRTRNALLRETTGRPAPSEK